MARNKWNRIADAGEAGKGMGQALSGIGEGIFRAFNGGMTPDQKMTQQTKLDDETRQRGFQMEDESRRIKNNLILQNALGNPTGIISPEMQDMRKTAFEQGGTPMPPTMDIAGLQIDPAFAAKMKRDEQRQIIEDSIEKAKRIHEATRGFTSTSPQLIGLGDRGGSKVPLLMHNGQITEGQLPEGVSFDQARGISTPQAPTQRLTPQQDQMLKSIRSRRNVLSQSMDSTFDPNGRLKLQRQLQDLDNQEQSLISELSSPRATGGAQGDPLGILQ